MMPTITTALLLNPLLRTGEAVQRLQASDEPWVALRRTRGLVVFWHVLDRVAALGRLSAADPAGSVREALALRDDQAVPVLQRAEAEADTAPAIGAVVLDGSRFVGVRPARPPQAPHEEATPAPYSLPPVASAPAAAPTSAPRAGAPRRIPRGLDEAPPGRVTRGPRAAPPPRGLPAAAEPPAAAGATSAFTAHPRLDAPERVDAGQRFELAVGLGSTAQAGVMGGPLRLELPPEQQQFTLELLLLVDGFEAPGGLRHTLQVRRDNPDAAVLRIPLIAPAVSAEEEALLSTLAVVYLFQGQPCGTASRRIAVLAPGRMPLDYPVGQGQAWNAAPARAQPISVQAGLPPIDLTVIIAKPDEDPTDGNYVWSFQNPHGAPVPAAGLRRSLGGDSASLGGKIITEVQNNQQAMMAELMVQGLGKSISAAMPPEFWTLLGQVHQALQAQGAGRLPSVLFLTAEPHVPWELALVPPAQRLLPAAPPLLGCQVNMARWPLHDAAVPPRSGVQVQHLAVVAGDYAARSGWRKLDKAEDEARTLAQRYASQAVSMPADAAQVKRLLYARLGEADAPHGAQAVHFACHGEAMQDHALDAAIILENGQRLNPVVFAAAPLGSSCAPFLFMNACQVGRAGELLASFSGFAGESIKGGFSAFLAPLWSVDDAIAHDIALEFYQRALGPQAGTPGEPVAAILRDLRGRFSDDENNSLTRLAYVFYGHPGLTLTRH